MYHEWGITDCQSSHGEITREHCKATCDNDTSCLAFIDLIGFDVCIFCTYTPRTHPGKWVEDSIAVTFIRNCVSATGSTNGTTGSPCNSDTDCVAAHTQCLAHVCLCSPGYVIDTTALQCVSGKCCIPFWLSSGGVVSAAVPAVPLFGILLRKNQPICKAVSKLVAEI